MCGFAVAVRARQLGPRTGCPLPARCPLAGTRCWRCPFPTSRLAGGNSRGTTGRIELDTSPIPSSSAARSTRNRSAKHYRHRASPDCNTVASFDSSSSESRNGLNRYYRQAWENLHESAGSKAGLKAASSNHSPLKRKETLDEPYRNGERHRDGSELVVTEAFSGNKAAEKKRHHHHHHHHDGRQHKDGREWRDPKPPLHRDQKRY